MPASHNTEAEQRIRFLNPSLGQHRPREVDLWNRGTNAVKQTTTGFIEAASDNRQFMIVPPDTKVAWDIYAVMVQEDNGIDAADTPSLFYVEYLGVRDANNQAIGGIRTGGARPIPIDSGTMQSNGALIGNQRVFPNGDTTVTRKDLLPASTPFPFEARLKTFSALGLAVNYATTATAGNRNVNILSAVRERRFE